MAKRKRKDVADVRPGREQSQLDEPVTRGANFWKLEGRDAGASLLNWVETRRAYLRGYNTLDLIHEAIYEGRPVGRRITTAAMDFLRAQSQASSYLNVLQSMVDTVVARIGKHRSMPVISCDDAEYSEKLYAERASSVLRRKMGQPSVERMMPMLLRDGVVRGDGFVEAYRNGGDIAIERFPRSELVFDDGESRNGETRTLARVKLVDRDVLAARYPKAAKRIYAVQPAARDYWTSYDYDSPIDNDQVEITVGWRLPTSPGAQDGCKLVVIRDEGEPLDECVWTRPRFPVARVQWTPAMRGFYGIGLIQQLAGSQNKVNELWTDHQEALYWGSGLKVFLPRAASIDKHQLRARHPIVVEYDGQVPQYVAPDPASRQAMDSLRWLIQQMYEISGISQLAAAAKSTLGPNASGKAINTMDELQSDRHSQIDLQFSMGRVDVGMIILDEAKALAADDDRAENIELAPWIDEIEWDRFDFDGGAYHLNIEPINFLPDTRAGKLDALGDLGKIPGFLTSPLQTASLFEEPDIQREFRYLLGPKRYLERVMGMLGDIRVPLTDCVPTPQMDPVLALDMAKGYHGDAFSRNASENVLGRYRWFMSMLEGEQKMKTPLPAPGPAAGAMPPPGALPPGPASPPPMPMGPPDAGGPMAPIIGPEGGIGPMVADPMGGASAQLAAGMSLGTQGAF